MSQIPSYKIRKPWYIILEHAESNSDIMDKAKRDLPIVDKFDFKTIQISDEEKAFNESLKINYKQCYTIHEASDSVGQIGKAIEDHWIEYVEKDKNSDFQKVFGVFFATLNTDKTKRNSYRKSTFRLDVDVPIINYSNEELWSSVNKKKILNPNEKKVKLHTSKGLALVICKIAIIRLQAQINDPMNKTLVSALREDLQIVKDIKAHINQDKDSDEEFKDIFNQHKKFWLSNEDTIPPILHKSNWICYERTDGVANKDGDWGIAQSVVSIEAPPQQRESHTIITMQSKYGMTDYFYEGIRAQTKLSFKQPERGPFLGR